MSPNDSGMHIRVEMELRDAFVQAFRAKDMAAGDVLWDFMSVYTDKTRQSRTDRSVGTKGRRN
jgi:hypothetical protein